MRALDVVLDHREKLFQLVHDDQQLGLGVGEDAVDRPGDAELVALELAPSARAAARRQRPGAAVSSSRNGCDPGSSSITYQRSEPGIAPAPQRGHQPGPNHRGLPRPGGPTTARNRAAGSSSARLSDQPLDDGLSPEEVDRRPPRGTRAGPCTGCGSDPLGSSATRRPLERGPELRRDLVDVGEPVASGPSRSRARSPRRPPRGRSGRSVAPRGARRARGGRAGGE